MTFAIIRDVVLFIIAIYGAVLSSVNWWQARQRDRRRIVVHSSTYTPWFEDGTLGQCFISVEATNAGQRPVTVTLLTLEIEGQNRIFPMRSLEFPGINDTPLPASLADGQTAKRHFPYRDVASALIEHVGASTIAVTPVCEDSLGGIHRGKPMEVNPLKWSRM